MSAQSTPSADEVLTAIATSFAADPEVARTRMFGSDGLKAAGKVFAIATRGKVVLKLPKARVDELVSAGARRFEPGMGRVMKEWVV
jgi:TfoX/Sxy family transcriptional regulator of competence genes